MPDEKPPAVLSLKITADAIIAYALCHEFDHNQTNELHAKLDEAMRSTPFLPVILELSQVHTLNSVAFGSLVDLMQTAKSQDRAFILAGVSDFVLSIFGATRMDSLFCFSKNLDAALEQIKSR